MLDWVTEAIADWGYGGIAFLMLLENILPPIPSELIMPLAGFTVTQGKLNFVAVAIAGTMGSVIGALPWYYIGKRISERKLRDWINRYGHWLTLSEQDIDRSQQWFSRHGSFVVLIGRLIPGIRTYISVPAGLEDMRFIPFLLYSTLGTLIWVSFLTAVGYLLGQNFEKVETVLSPISNLVIGTLLVITLSVWLLRRRKQ